MPLDLPPLPHRPQRGVTLVELMVALAVSMIVALAAMAALNTARVSRSMTRLLSCGKTVVLCRICCNAWWCRQASKT